MLHAICNFDDELAALVCRFDHVQPAIWVISKLN